MKSSLLIATWVAACAGTAYGQAAVCPGSPVNCDDTVEIPNPVYVLTADTQENLLKALGKKLRPTGAMHRQMTIVYRNSSSCTNVSSIFGATQATSGTLSYIPSNTNWDEKTTCTCNVSTPTSFQVASSAIFTEACGQTKPSTIGLFRGPLQGYMFVVRKNSPEVAITGDEAYFTWGFGNMGMVSPWNMELYMLKRPVDASTLICTMAAAGISPVSKTRGREFSRSADLLTELTAGTSPDDKTIGMLGCAPYDRQRAAMTVKALAFKAQGQKFAYFPDSTASSFDKRNMRDGRYTPWSVTDWLTPVDGGGAPTDANAAYLINLILDKPVSPVPGFDPLDSVMTAGLVPECAMNVTRSQEGGNLSPYQSVTPCHCAFDKKFATSSCTACTDDSSCGTGKCRHGFCEPR